MSNSLGLDLARIERVLAEERARFEATHPKSAALHARGQRAFLYGTPLHWMQLWPGGFPPYMERAQGAHLWDVDGHQHVDFCLGDSGSFFGHSHPAIAAAIAEQAGRGVTAMLPSETGVIVAEQLQQRFGLPYWQMATSATDANRFALRLARIVTGRDKVLVFQGNYHGSVDETQVELDEQGALRPRLNVHPNGVDHRRVARICEFNDLEGLERELAHGDVACVLAEPLMTNCGMVPAQPGYHEGLRALTKKYGSLLIIDETHTISTGPGGCTRAWGLRPDIFVLGKAIAGGIPCAVYGVTEELAQRIWAAKPPVAAGGERRYIHAGFGGTLVGNQLSLAALRATLEQVMTEAGYAHMARLSTRIAAHVRDEIARRRLPWHVTQIGARSEYMFTPEPPRNGSQAKAGRHALLECAIHLFLLNRGVLITPFHNMMLVCPEASDADVDRHNQAFSECLDALGAGR